jgi:hypothetical protein
MLLAVVGGGLVLAALATWFAVDSLRSRPHTGEAGANGGPSTQGLTDSNAAPLEGELSVRIFGTGRGNDGQEASKTTALPVRKGEQVHLEVRMKEPAYVYLLWIDGQGNLDPHYPWDREFAKRRDDARVDHPVREVHSPAEVNKGWYMEGPAGLETVILLARRTPLDKDLATLVGKLGPVAPASPQEMTTMEFDRDNPPRIGRIDRDRGASKRKAQIDNSLRGLLEQLREDFEMGRAVRFAYQGE